ncbi:MFS transporter [Brooklawnia cerclae]|uniref:MFS family permease n=1 Tax=Brooklawnia cerclae TaxID=349934 RepID=A0ABX0SFU7_9ACTN|nr:MFS transporter [Brooklawnia cerclae]NIH55511.1 MFS family permease [Brooklawnia cerclae]
MSMVKEEFNLSNTHIGWLNAVFFIGFILGAYVFGIVSDRIGTGWRRTWTWNVAMLFAIVGGALTFGASGSFIAFLLWRLPMGISRGGSEPVNVAIVSEWWPKEHRGFALGVHHAGFPWGQFLVGPLLVGIAAFGGGWREAFLIIPLLGLVVIAAQSFLGTEKHQRAVYDYIDAHGQTRPAPDLSVKVKESVWDQFLTAFRVPNARRAMLVGFVMLWAEAGATSFLTIQLTERGISTSQAVVIAGASGLTGWIGQIVWGTLSDHIGRKLSLGIILTGWAISVGTMFFISTATTGWLILLFWGLFRNSPFPVIYAILSDSVPKASGSAMGVMIGSALGISGIFAATVAGMVIDNLGWGAHYIVMVVILLLGFIPLARIKETVRTARSVSVSEA